MSFHEPNPQPILNQAMDDFRRLVDACCRVQDLLTDIGPDPEALARAATLLERAGSLLEPVPTVDLENDPFAAPNKDPRFGVRLRGQVPEFTIAEESAEFMRGTTLFRPFFNGFGAVHGGSITMFFDDVLGRQANNDFGMMARTAYLNVDFRRPVPVGTVVEFTTRVDNVDGRKRYLRGTISDGDIILAEAAGLWIELRRLPVGDVSS